MRKDDYIYKVYNKTMGFYPTNANRNNPYYLKVGHAQRGLRQYQYRFPGDEFEIHVFKLVYDHTEV